MRKNLNPFAIQEEQWSVCIAMNILTKDTVYLRFKCMKVINSMANCTE